MERNSGVMQISFHLRGKIVVSGNSRYQETKVSYKQVDRLCVVERSRRCVTSKRSWA